MKFFQIIIIAVSFLVLPYSAVAVQEATLVLGDLEVTYSNLLLVDDNGDSVPDKWTYTHVEVRGDDPFIIASAYDTNDDENPDVWLVYDAQGVLTLEAHDTDNDGEADVFFELDADEVVTSQYGDRLSEFERELTPPEPFLVPGEVGGDASVDVLVGDLSDIDALYTKGSSGLVLPILIILILIGVGGYLWHFKKKREETPTEPVSEESEGQQN